MLGKKCSLAPLKEELRKQGVSDTSDRVLMPSFPVNASGWYTVQISYFHIASQIVSLFFIVFSLYFILCPTLITIMLKQRRKQSSAFHPDNRARHCLLLKLLFAVLLSFTDAGFVNWL